MLSRALVVASAFGAVLFGFTGSLRGADERAMHSALDQFTGEWSGQVQVRALDGFVLKTVQAMRRYTWQGDEQVVETTLSDGGGEYVTVSRQAVRLGRLESRVSRPALPDDSYVGAMESNALVWTNAEGNRRDAREQLTERGGAPVLESTSVEAIRGLGLSGLVRVSGEFRRAATAVATAPLPATAASSAELDVMRHELETAQRRATELERELGQARSDADAARSAAGGGATEIDRLGKELEAARQERQTAEEAAHARQAEVDALNSRLAAANDAVARITDERDRLMQRALPLQRDNEALVRSADSLKATVAGLTDEVTALKFRLLEVERTSGAAGEENTELRRQLAEGEERQRADRQELAELRGRPVIDLAAGERERERNELRGRVAALESEITQRQQDNEQLLATIQRAEQERAALSQQVVALETRLAATPAPQPAPAESGTSIAATVRDKLVAEVQHMERRVLELESERNTAREQAVLLQQQIEEVRRLRDDTLARFQTVVAELNAMRDEKERLARANLSLQAEVRSAQQSSRATVASPSAPRATGGVVPSSPSTTADGRTADMVVAGLQVIGVTRGETEDKAILDGRLYRNGDIVEPELGIVFDRIEDNALIFHDRRGREYRRRF